MHICGTMEKVGVETTIDARVSCIGRFAGKIPKSRREHILEDDFDLINGTIF